MTTRDVALDKAMKRLYRVDRVVRHLDCPSDECPACSAAEIRPRVVREVAS